MSHPSQNAATTEAVSPWAALVKVLHEPTATFQGLGSHPGILPGYLVQTAFGLLGALFMLPTIQKAMDAQMAAQGGPPGALAFAKVFATGSAVFGALIGPWIAGVVVTLIAMLFGQFQGGGVGFSQYFGMLGYARIPLAIGGALTALMQYLTGDIMASVSLGVLLPAGTSPVLKAALATINPFDLWYFVLLCVGFATLHRTKPSKGIALSATLYVLGLLMALAGGAMAKVTPGM